MTSLMDVFVTVKPDMDKFGPEVKNKLARIDAKADGAKVAGRFGVGFNGAFGGIVKHSAGLFVGAFAAIKGAQFLGGFINDARESAKVGRISAQVIKSTGGVAGITAAQIGDLATQISNKTGADDEAIQSGENLLATFTNVRNETGKGNDIFNRATQAAVDMAAAMNNGVVDANGLKGANIQLGKALNDPIKGVSALSKVGVSFTADQKKQIKTLVDSGKTLDAQKIILSEVGKEFGGAAQAAADPLTRLTTIGGNLAEKVGGFLLPSVDKFATFMGDTAIPKISAFSDVFAAKVTPKLQEFGGFVKDQVLPRLVQFAGFLKEQVVPRVLEFGNFLVTKVIPAVAGFVSNLVTSLAPAVQSVFGFFKTEVIPRLKEFGEFLGDKVLPKVGELATSLSKNKDFLVPFAATLVTIIAGLKAWAIAQGILNLVMSANPIGLVVLAIAGLVAGLVYAYKHSDKFREIVDKAFRVAAAAGKFMWEAVLKPTFDLLKLAFQEVWLKAQTWAGFVIGAFNAIKGPAVSVFRWVIEKMLDFVGSMLDGAAAAFGWVPKLGGPLKNAAKEFRTFRDNTNAALRGINDEPVNIKVDLAYTAALGQKTKQMKFADGGGVFGGTRGKDSVPALLMPDEHVWTTREVRAAGGHSAMERMRQAALAGELNGYADGGVVVHPQVPSRRRVQYLANTAAGDVSHTGTVMANAIAKNMTDGLGGPPGARKAFRGVTLNTRTIGMLLRAERLLGRIFHITQGSYSTRVAASGSTHAGGGAMDTDGPGGWNTAVRALRAVGFAAWHRTPAMGPWGHHIHSIALGDSSASPAAKAQMAAFRRGGDGLGHGMAMGGRVLMNSYAKGAWDLPMDQAAILHRGEMVIPANLAGWMRGHWFRSLHERHLLHVAHNKHQAHAAHVAHQLPRSQMGNLGRFPIRQAMQGLRGAPTSAIPGGGDVLTVRLHDDDRRLLSDVRAKVYLDSRELSDGMARRAMDGGYS